MLAKSNLVCVAANLVLLSLPSITIAAQPVVLGSAVAASRRVGMEMIDHGGWTRLLQKHVDVTGMVDYGGWKSSPEDQRGLDEYLSHLSAAKLDGSASRASQLAFWINAYNSMTIKGILREYPTTSIRKHTSSFGGYNVWKHLLLPVGDRTYSLEQIEHEVLRKMDEPRIHFAIVCASVGCPKLRSEAYVPAKLDEQLNENAGQFFADRSKFSYDPARGSIQVSPILKWFGDDFGENPAAQMRTIAPFLPDPAARKLAASGTARVSFLDYDWSLNDQASFRNASRR